MNGGREGAGPGDWRVRGVCVCVGAGGGGVSPTQTHRQPSSVCVCWGWGRGGVSHPDAQAAQQAHWGLGAGRGRTQSTQAVDTARGLSITRLP